MITKELILVIQHYALAQARSSFIHSPSSHGSAISIIPIHLVPSAFLYTTRLHTQSLQRQSSSDCRSTHSHLQFGIPQTPFCSRCHTARPNHTVRCPTHRLPISLHHHSNPTPDCVQFHSHPLHSLLAVYGMQYPLRSLHSNTIPLPQNGLSQSVLHDTDTIHFYTTLDKQHSQHPSISISQYSRFFRTLHQSSQRFIPSFVLPSQMDATHHSSFHPTHIHQLLHAPSVLFNLKAPPEGNRPVLMDTFTCLSNSNLYVPSPCGKIIIHKPNAWCYAEHFN